MDYPSNFISQTHVELLVGYGNVVAGIFCGISIMVALYFIARSAWRSSLFVGLIYITSIFGSMIYLYLLSTRILEWPAVYPDQAILWIISDLLRMFSLVSFHIVVGLYINRK